MAILNGKEILFSAALSKPTSQKLVKLTAPDAQLTPAAFQEYPAGVGYRSSDFTPAGATAYLDSTDKEAVFFAITDTTATPVGLTIDLGEEKEVELLQLYYFQTFQSVSFGIYTSTDGAAFELAGVQSIGGDSHGAKEVQRLSVNAKARYIRLQQQEGWTRYRFVLKGLEVFGPVTSGSYDLIKDGATQESISVDEIFEKGSEAGRTQEWSDFWDVFQDYGKRVYYGYIFRWFDDNVFKPKYDIKPTSAAGAFQSAKITNLKQILKDRGVVLDLSACTNMAEIFSGASITHVPTMDTRQAAGITSVFSSAGALVEIEKLILRENGTQTLNNTFNKASSLENIAIEGTIGANIQLQWSTKLTRDSLMSIINALKDYSTDTSGTTHTVQIGSTNIAKLTGEELETITQKGWTYK